MKHKRGAAMVAALAITLGGTAALAATQGSQSDPLITLSYLEQVFKPQVEQEVNNAVAEGAGALAGQLDAAIAGYESRVTTALNTAGADLSAFRRQSLGQQETLLPGAGREFLLVSGSAAAVGELADTTAGVMVENGQALEAGHLYITAGADAGCQAGPGATVMCR